MSEPKHAFYATRKGVPKGVTGTGWHRFCDECGEGPNHPNHDVSQSEQGESLLRALKADDGPGGW